MSRLPPEVIRARSLVAKSKLLIEIARAGVSELETEIQRADNLMAISREILEPQVQELLLDLPMDGGWMPCAGPYTDIINDMLDGGSLLIEEDEMPEKDDAPWRVRLTTEAIEILA